MNNTPTEALFRLLICYQVLPESATKGPNCLDMSCIAAILATE